MKSTLLASTREKGVLALLLITELGGVKVDKEAFLGLTEGVLLPLFN